MIGKIGCGLGFKDIVFQSELCSTGSLGDVLSGLHYSCSWVIHNAVTEAMERLLLLRLFRETKLQPPESLVKISAELELFSPNIQDVSAEVHCSVESFKQAIRDGKLGKTPQFLLLYLDMMRNQHMINLAVQENNFDLRLATWKNWLPLYFATNQFNYTRYGSYYVEVLANIETLYPGLKQLLQKTGLSLQAQEMYPTRVAIDQRGEETINRDAKTKSKVS